MRADRRGRASIGCGRHQVRTCEQGRRRGDPLPVPLPGDLLDAYETWLAAHDLPPQTNGGRCLVDRPSEGGYVPGDDHGIVVAERGGCYLDGSGKAQYAVTLPPFVLAEVDGKVKDIAAVEGWAGAGTRTSRAADELVEHQE